MLEQSTSTDRLRKFQALAGAVLVLLLAKVFVSILLEYRYYFPPDFDSAFLTGRRATFTTFYAIGFYTHLVSGPLTLLLGTYLMWSGGRARYRLLHRWAGRTQMALVLGALSPSGLIMAGQAFAGPIAGIGFAALSLATAACLLAAVYFASQRQFTRHQRWATRCYVLLVSPLILRLVSGVLIVTQLESEATYRMNSWFSWLVPWLVYEIVWRCKTRTRSAPKSLNRRELAIESQT